MNNFNLRTITIIFLLMSMLAFALPAKARVELFDAQEISDCKAKARDRVKYGVCLDAKLAELERQVKVWENNVELKLLELSQMSGANTALIMFAKSTEQFDKYLKMHCQWVYLSMLPNVFSAATLTKECKISESKNRIERLKQISAKDFYD